MSIFNVDLWFSSNAHSLVPYWACMETEMNNSTFIRIIPKNDDHVQYTV